VSTRMFCPEGVVCSRVFSRKSGSVRSSVMRAVSYAQTNRMRRMDGLPVHGSRSWEGATARACERVDRTRLNPSRTDDPPQRSNGTPVLPGFGFILLTRAVTPPYAPACLGGNGKSTLARATNPSRHIHAPQVSSISSVPRSPRVPGPRPLANLCDSGGPGRWSRERFFSHLAPFTAFGGTLGWRSGHALLLQPHR
jgi:hypothetical protein